MLKSVLPITSVCRQAPLLASQILTVPSHDADASRAVSCEKATEETLSLWPSGVCRKALHSSYIGGLIATYFSSSLLKDPISGCYLD
jgi:hypothetical protein